MNKRNAICRIIIFSLLIGGLLTLLIFGIQKGSFPLVFHLGGMEQYANASQYKTGNASLEADALKRLKINWLDGTIQVLPYEGEHIVIEETSSGTLDKKEQLHYYWKQNTLIIQYRENSFFSFGKSSNNKNLTVRIPTKLCGELSELSIDCTSSEVHLNGLHTNILKLDSVSGNFTATDMFVAKDGSLNTVSGNINVSGEIQKMDVDTVSGDCRLTSAISPRELEFDSTSGDIFLQIPESSDFTFEFDSVSGDMNSHFSTIQKEDFYLCGKGTAQYEADTVSGDITIQPIKTT